MPKTEIVAKKLLSEENFESKMSTKTRSFSKMIASDGQVINQSIDYIAKDRDDFFKVFFQNVTVLKDLSKNAILVAMYASTELIIKYRKDYTANIFFLTPDMRKNIEVNVGVLRQRIPQAIKELVEAGVIIPIPDEKREQFKIEKDVRKNAYVMNPTFIGRGDFAKIEEVRQIIKQTFDFKSLTFKREVVLETELENDGFKDKFQKNMLEIESAEEEINGNVTNQTITFTDKTPPQPQEPQALPAPQPQGKSEKEIELELVKAQAEADKAKAELVKEQNRAKELENKKIELTTKRIEMLLEYKKCSIESDESLFNADGSFNEEIIKNDKDL